MTARLLLVSGLGKKEIGNEGSLNLRLPLTRFSLCQPVADRRAVPTETDTAFTLRLLKVRVQARIYRCLHRRDCQRCLKAPEFVGSQV